MQELRKDREIQLNQQTIRCQVLADMIKFGAVSYLLSCTMDYSVHNLRTQI